MIAHYRIYPSWFAPCPAWSSERMLVNVAGEPMNELAFSSAARMGCTVERIKVVGDGTDHRGRYLDFDVTYSSSEGGLHVFRPRSSDR